MKTPNGVSGVFLMSCRLRNDANGGGEWLELRIHEDIERGDNDSIKIGGKSVKVDKACSS